MRGGTGAPLPPGQLADAGVDSFVLRAPGDSVDHAVAALQQYAETFLKR